MKASKLVKDLQNLIDIWGDVKITSWDKPLECDLSVRVASLSDGEVVFMVPTHKNEKLTEGTDTPQSSTDNYFQGPCKTEPVKPSAGPNPPLHPGIATFND